jgi:hypothetical protein
LSTQHPLVQHFIRLIDGWNAAGWGEFLLFEVLEGTREKPFAFLDPLPASDLEVCQRLRDELKVWPFWVADERVWDCAPIAMWRRIAEQTSADQIRARLSK